MTFSNVKLCTTEARGRFGYRQTSSAFVIAALFLMCLGQLTPLSAQDAYIGDLSLVPYNFAPRGWAECNGQLLPIAQHTALFSLLGTTYGGDGRTTFALPNLNDRTPLHVGQGPGLSAYAQGQISGAPTHTLSVNEMATHTHPLFRNSAVGSTDNPAGKFFAASESGAPLYHADQAGLTDAPVITANGGGQAHNNWQPYLGLKWVICLQGTYPSRP